MRKLLLIAIMVFALAVCAYAADTSGATYYSPNDSGFGNWLSDLANDQECIDHNHKYVDRDTVYDKSYELGAGLDLIVYQAEPDANPVIPDEVTVESKWDFNNQEGSTYVVAKYNIFELFKSAE